VLGCQVDKVGALVRQEGELQDQERLGVPSHGRLEGPGEIVRRLAQCHRVHLDSRYSRRGFHHAELVGGKWRPEHRHPGDLRQNLLEEFQPFGG
jgi:hypothetical protein